jgi:hypothetical protein
MQSFTTRNARNISVQYLTQYLTHSSGLATSSTITSMKVNSYMDLDLSLNEIY